MSKSLSIAMAVQRKSKMSKGAAPTKPMAPVEIKAADLSPDERADSIADAIIQKRKMANGGMVDLDAGSEEAGNMGDELNMDALGKEQYSDEQLSDQPMDSKGDEDEDMKSDKMDMIGKIRAKMKGKAGA